MAPVQSYLNDIDMFIRGENFWQASLLKQLEGMDFNQALYKPAPDRHCIWEIVRHISYWKYWAITYLKDNVKLNAKEENWKKLPDTLNEDTWQDEINKLKSLVEQCENIARLVGDELFVSDDEKIIFFRQLLYHDCYHTGQIGLLRVLQGLKPVT
jgi:hypothetical protein